MIIEIYGTFGFVAVDTEICDVGDVDGFYDGWAGAFVLWAVVSAAPDAVLVVVPKKNM